MFVCRVARRWICDAFVSRPLDFAEIAAGDLILREAGGKITSGVEIVATNGHIEL